MTSYGDLRSERISLCASCGKKQLFSYPAHLVAPVSLVLLLVLWTYIAFFGETDGTNASAFFGTYGGWAVLV